MKDELTQKELDQIFYGKDPKIKARFFDHQVLDPTASRAAGHRVMKTVPYVELKCEKEGTHIQRAAGPEDWRKHPVKWEKFLKAKSVEKTAEGPTDELPGQVPDARTERDCTFLPAGTYPIQ